MAIKSTPLNRGFSLIEVLIVVAILGLVGMIALPSLTGSFRFSVKSTAQEIGTLIKDAVNSAQITGKIHRIVYDLKNQQYWAEFTSDATLLQGVESKEFEKQRSQSFSSNSEKDEEDKKKNGGFLQAKTLTGKKRSLPVGVILKDVYTEQTEAPISEGLAYTHIFPHGRTEQSLVHLTDSSKNDVTLIISNLLGRSQVEGRYIDAAEAFGKGGESK